MRRRPRVFLDTSVIFAALLSPSGGSRLLLKLGEAGVCQLFVGSRVLGEADGVVRRKAPDQHGLLALLLDRAGVMVGPEPMESDLDLARSAVDYAPDAQALAEAIAADADRFVTLDHKYFLDPGDRVELDALPLVVETPGDCMAWLRRRLPMG